MPIPFSILDLAPIVTGSTAAQAFANSLDLARHAEAWGYTRYWVAEHHNISGIASAATAVVIAHLAAGTKTLRVGSGGIMLPNHAPLTIAEQFGTLESLFPGRIDLGIGRAPGGDMRTARALRRNLGSDGDTFPQDLIELQSYFHPPTPAPPVHAVPGEGLNIPIYLLGSSDFSARLAGQLGLPFAFASHFAPDYLGVALPLYRSLFQPSAQLQKPHAMIGINVFVADTDAEAKRLFTTLQQAFLNLIRGAPRQLVPPIENMNGAWSYAEQSHVNRMTYYSAVGSPTTIRSRIAQLLEDTQADELIFTANIFDHHARLRSFEIAADVMKQLNTPLLTQ